MNTAKLCLLLSCLAYSLTLEMEVRGGDVRMTFVLNCMSIVQMILNYLCGSDQHHHMIVT
jgi:hypothetical protein